MDDSRKTKAQLMRELEEERALEKVRTQVAAMRASDDLPRVVEEIERMLKELGVSCQVVSINVIDERSGRIRFIGGGSEVATGIYAGIALRWYERWKQGATWSRSGEDMVRGLSARSMFADLKANLERLDIAHLEKTLRERGVPDEDFREWLETGRISEELLQPFAHYLDEYQRLDFEQNWGSMCCLCQLRISC